MRTLYGIGVSGIEPPRSANQHSSRQIKVGLTQNLNAVNFYFLSSFFFKYSTAVADPSSNRVSKIGRSQVDMVYGHVRHCSKYSFHM